MAKNVLYAFGKPVSGKENYNFSTGLNATTDANGDVTIAVKQNARAVEGYVPAVNTNAIKVYSTDASGNPAWRDPSAHSHDTQYYTKNYINGLVGDVTESTLGFGSGSVSSALTALNNNLNNKKIDTFYISQGGYDTLQDIYNNTSVDTVKLYTLLYTSNDAPKSSGSNWAVICIKYAFGNQVIFIAIHHSYNVEIYFRWSLSGNWIPIT